MFPHSPLHSCSDGRGKVARYILSGEHRELMHPLRLDLPQCLFVVQARPFQIIRQMLNFQVGRTHTVSSYHNIRTASFIQFAEG